MRAIQKLVKNGNSTAVAIARPILIELGWLPGEAVIVEITADRSLLVRRPNDRDFSPIGQPRILHGTPAEAKP